jgi:hypothetical protein
LTSQTKLEKVRNFPTDGHPDQTQKSPHAAGKDSEMKKAQKVKPKLPWRKREMFPLLGAAEGSIMEHQQRTIRLFALVAALGDACERLSGGRKGRHA